MSSIFQLALTTALAAFAGSGLVFVLDWNTLVTYPKQLLA